MDKQSKKQTRRDRRRAGIRKRVSGTPERPRLCVRRSLNHLYVQVVDDLAGHTLASASTRDKDFSGDAKGNTDAAKKIGMTIAERAKAAGVENVAFDRSGFRYHGRIKAMADAAREGGLKF